jgi:hypothetical protein
MLDEKGVLSAQRPRRKRFVSEILKFGSASMISLKIFGLDYEQALRPATT